MQPRYIEEAKKIIGKWGYEEEYWWKPIAKALAAAELRGAEKIVDRVMLVGIEASVSHVVDAAQKSLAEMRGE